MSTVSIADVRRTLAELEAKRRNDIKTKYINASTIKALESTAQWEAFYVEAARRMREECYSRVELQQRMRILVDLAVESRAASLRNSDTRLASRFATAKVGMYPIPIPGVQAGTMAGTTAWFVKRAIQGFGLKDRARIIGLHVEACSKAGLVTNDEEFVEHLHKEITSEVRKKYVEEPAKEQAKQLWNDPDLDLQGELMRELSGEFGQDTAEMIITDAYHFLPLLGQILKAGNGWVKSGEQTMKALAYLKTSATDFHKTVLVTVAIQRARPYPPPPARTRAVASTPASQEWDGKKVAEAALVVAGTYLTGRVPMTPLVAETGANAVKAAWNWWNS